MSSYTCRVTHLSSCSGRFQSWNFAIPHWQKTVITITHNKQIKRQGHRCVSVSVLSLAIQCHVCHLLGSMSSTKLHKTLSEDDMVFIFVLKRVHRYFRFALTFRCLRWLTSALTAPMLFWHCLLLFCVDEMFSRNKWTY